MDISPTIRAAQLFCEFREESHDYFIKSCLLTYLEEQQASDSLCYKFSDWEKKKKKNERRKDINLLKISNMFYPV